MLRLDAPFAGRLLHGEPLAKYTAARLGGAADYIYIARESVDELVAVVGAAWAQGVPVRVLGGGANVLIADAGLRGLVVINHISDIQFQQWYGGRSAAASAGTTLTVFANKCQKQGLSGMEWAVSVPGTVGGAIINNAGAHGDDTAASVREVVILQPDGPKLYKNADMAYAYRYSSLKARSLNGSGTGEPPFVVLMATFVLPEDDPEAIKRRMEEYRAHRKRTQPPGASLGSIFKNPPDDYAGRLIEQAGLKGHRIGSAMVSPLHANFFINDAGGSAADYHQLIQHVQRIVHEKYGIRLEMEIELLGEWG